MDGRLLLGENSDRQTLQCDKCNVSIKAKGHNLTHIYDKKWGTGSDYSKKEAEGRFCLGREPGHLLDGLQLIPQLTRAQIAFQPRKQWLPYVLSVLERSEHVALVWFMREECFRTYFLTAHAVIDPGKSADFQGLRATWGLMGMQRWHK